MKKILYVLLHGTSSSDRYFNVKETWGKNVDCLFCSDYEDIERGIMKFSNDTSYGSNEEKHVNAIKHLSDNVDDYEWFFLCDDDTFVNTKKLEGMLDTFDKELIHGQSILGCWHTDKTLDYCSGGAGYLIHNELIKIIGKNIKVLGTGTADVTLGYCLRDMNLKNKDCDLFKSQPPSFYSIPINQTEEYITFHYIKTKGDMLTLLQRVI